MITTPGRRAKSHLGHYSPGKSLRPMPPLSYTVPANPNAYPMPTPQRLSTPDGWNMRDPDTGELPSLSRTARHLAPHKPFSRFQMMYAAPQLPPQSSLLLQCPYRTSRPSGVSIENGHALNGAPNAPAKHNSNRHVVLYTHDSPFITARAALAKKMTAADFERLSERYGYAANELLRFHKFFSKIQTGKGVDQTGMAAFVAKFGNVDPTDEFVVKRLFEISNKRNHPTITFEQTIGLLSIIQPPQNVFDPEQMAASEAPNTIAKTHLFFDIIDTNDSDSLCLREIEDMCRVKNTERLDVAKERRKMMLEKVMKTIYDRLGKTEHSSISREELLHAVGTTEEVNKFFSKGLFLSANLQ